MNMAFSACHGDIGASSGGERGHYLQVVIVALADHLSSGAVACGTRGASTYAGAATRKLEDARRRSVAQLASRDAARAAAAANAQSG